MDFSALTMDFSVLTMDFRNMIMDNGKLKNSSFFILHSTVLSP